MVSDIQDFVASLFWILESKRVEASRESSGDKLTLLCAPFERKDFVGLDMESRNNRKRVVGRLKKNLADLSLQAGLLAEAWNYYQVNLTFLETKMHSGAFRRWLLMFSDLQMIGFGLLRPWKVFYVPDIH